MAQVFLVQKELQPAYEIAERHLIEWMNLALENLPPAYVYLLLSFRANDFLQQIRVPYEAKQDEQG